MEKISGIVGAFIPKRHHRIGMDRNDRVEKALDAPFNGMSSKLGYNPEQRIRSLRSMNPSFRDLL